MVAVQTTRCCRLREAEAVCVDLRRRGGAEAHAANAASREPQGRRHQGLSARTTVYGHEGGVPSARETKESNEYKNCGRAEEEEGAGLAYRMASGNARGMKKSIDGTYDLEGMRSDHPRLTRSGHQVEGDEIGNGRGNARGMKKSIDGTYDLEGTTIPASRVPQEANRRPQQCAAPHAQIRCGPSQLPAKAREEDARVRRTRNSSLPHAFRTLEPERALREQARLARGERRRDREADVRAVRLWVQSPEEIGLQASAYILQRQEYRGKKEKSPIHHEILQYGFPNSWRPAPNICDTTFQTVAASPRNFPAWEWMSSRENHQSTILPVRNILRRVLIRPHLDLAIKKVITTDYRATWLMRMTEEEALGYNLLKRLVYKPQLIYYRVRSGIGLIAPYGHFSNSVGGGEGGRGRVWRHNIMIVARLTKDLPDLIRGSVFPTGSACNYVAAPGGTLVPGTHQSLSE
ncbi:hypothetical protein DFH09DRAFT_1086915 [Mycena vulgaris]|nr:hypothetical protein DFH09DRAFT_1086915 [Mycena vulgaris]